MADSVKISALPASTDAQMTDAGLIETAVADSSSSTGFTSKKSTLARLATYILNKFTGLSLAGSSQTVKSALDSLNSNKADLYSGTSLTSSNNLDNVKTAGNYRISNASSIPQNAPENSRGRMYVYDGMLSGDPNTLFQKYITYPSGVVYTRYYRSSTSAWTAWEKQPTRAEMDAATAATTVTQLRNTDLNTLTEPMRIYYAGGSHGCTNVPANAASFGLIVLQISSGYRAQICISSGLNVYIRRYASETWGSWFEFAKSAIS